MTQRSFLVLILTLLLPTSGAMGCASETSGSQSSAPSESTQSENQAVDNDPPDTATPRDEWIQKRVDKARKRLTDSEAGKLVWRSIEAHGGLERWFANGPLFFRFDYQPAGDRTARDTYNTVDTWSARARQELADNRDKQFGWDGKRAWQRPADGEFKINARFWALTPYYFVGMPFVLADSGVRLEKTGTAELHGSQHDVIKATFGEGVGDSPDDYYIVYLDSESGHFGGLRYIVSYPGFFPDGGHSDEKLMVFEGEQTVGGITFAETFPTYAWHEDEGERGDLVTEISMTDVEFRPETPDGYFEPPEDARLLEGY